MLVVAKFDQSRVRTASRDFDSASEARARRRAVYSVGAEQRVYGEGGGLWEVDNIPMYIHGLLYLQNYPDTA
jgi:hypothetical protein